MPLLEKLSIDHGSGLRTLSPEKILELFARDESADRQWKDDRAGSGAALPRLCK